MSRKLLPLVAFVVVTVAFVAVGEVAMRLYTSWFQFYDVEMTRYAMGVKERADDPRIGHVHRPRSEATLMGVPVRINGDGLRDRDYPIERTGARRLVFLGDSLTFGWGVEEDLRFESILERELGKRAPTEIINLGTGNYNTVQEVELFLAKGMKYKPDEVVVFWFVNDAEPTPQVSRWELLGHSRFVTFFWSRLKTLMSRVDERKSFQGYYAGLYGDGEPGWIAEQEAFLKLKRAADAGGFGLRVVLLPELHDPARQPFAGQHAKVMAFLARNGIAALDVTPAFKDVTEPLKLWVAPDDAHPNADAHAIIAKAVEPFLRKD
jgi:lysophospholipase L1-like esterase